MNFQAYILIFIIFLVVTALAGFLVAGFVDCIRREMHEQEDSSELDCMTAFVGCCAILGIYAVCKVATLFFNVDERMKEKHLKMQDACHEKTEIRIGKAAAEAGNIVLWRDVCHES